MTLDADDRALAPLLERLGPHARSLLSSAGEHALRLHADSVSPEHLLSTLMEDPRCAAHAAVLHAFADPRTIAEEALAISPGLLVVASGSILPFSVRAVRVLAGARADAEAAGEKEVGLERILGRAADALDEPLRRVLVDAGLSAGSGSPIAADPPACAGFFRPFSAAAKRMLSAANRLAAADKAPSISHVHLFLACLQEDEALSTRAGVGFRRARMLTSGRTLDDSAPSPRALPPDAALVEFLRRLRPGADSLALLAGFLGGSTPELEQILVRSKVNAALLERARNAFQDPLGLEADRPSRR